MSTYIVRKRPTFYKGSRGAFKKKWCFWVLKELEEKERRRYYTYPGRWIFRGTGMPHFLGMPRAIRGTTPCELASWWLTREHKHLAPLIPVPNLPTSLQHWLDGFTALFLLATTQGIIWKTSHPAASDDTTISEVMRSAKQRAGASRSFTLAVLLTIQKSRMIQVMLQSYEQVL